MNKFNKNINIDRVLEKVVTWICFVLFLFFFVIFLLLFCLFLFFNLLKYDLTTSIILVVCRWDQEFVFLEDFFFFFFFFWRRKIYLSSFPHKSIFYLFNFYLIYEILLMILWIALIKYLGESKELETQFSLSRCLCWRHEGDKPHRTVTCRSRLILSQC